MNLDNELHIELTDSSVVLPKLAVRASYQFN